MADYTKLAAEVRTKFGKGAARKLRAADKIPAVVYGHAHREGQWSSLVQGQRGGVRYAFVAANAIGFHPLKVGTLSG